MHWEEQPVIPTTYAAERRQNMAPPFSRPASPTYDEADRMVALTTFRANEGDITTDPSGRTDGDTTTRLYDPATGLELKKAYADGS